MRTLRNLAFVALMCIVFWFKGSSVGAQYQTCTAWVTTGCFANNDCGGGQWDPQTLCDAGCGAGWSNGEIVQVMCAPATPEQCGGSQTYNTANSVQVQCSRIAPCGACNTYGNQSDSSNYHLTAAADGVAFDFYGTGIPMRVAWTSPHSSVAFLVLDRNGNGIIDSGAELFGNLTPKRDGTMAANGFEALLDLDGGVGVSDGRMSVDDPFYSQLRLWIDRNHNGYSEVDELTTPAESGLTTIFTAYSESRHRDKYGNFYKYEGTALLARRNEEVARRVFDVFFAVEK
jgi:hypothetical protein